MKNLLVLVFLMIFISCQNDQIKIVHFKFEKKRQSLDTISEKFGGYRNSFSEYSLNDILSSIQFNEYMKREQGRGIYSEKRLQHIKDSINYDSIQDITEVPVFE